MGVVNTLKAGLKAVQPVIHAVRTVEAVVEEQGHIAILPGDPAWDIEAAFGFLDWGSQSLVDSWPGPWPALDAATARTRLEAFVAEALARLG